MDNNGSQRVSRRSFLTWGWAAFAAAIAAAAVATFRMLFPNVFQQPPTSVEFEAGRVNEVQVGTVDLRFIQNKIWLIRDPGRIFALVAECTNDMCTPDWKPDDEFFECPCCGSTYSREGLNIDGPAPRALERAAIRLSSDGQILVDKSRRFLYEKNEWNNPGAYLPA